MSEPIVAVVGAGLGGLAAGCFLRMNGYAVQVFEHADAPGGVARTRWAPDLRVQGGLYFLLECFPGLAAYEVYQALGMMPWDGVEPIDLYARLVDEPTKSALDVTRDLDKLSADLHALAPEDSALIDTLMKGARSFSHFDPVKAGFEKPPELSTFFDKMALGWHARHVLGVFSNKALIEHTLAEWIQPAKSAALREILLGFFPYPVVPPWFVMMILGLLARGQLGRMVGSSEDLVAKMEARLRALGGAVRYRAPVARVRVEEKRAVGVELEDGSFHAAHAVISTVDSAQLLDRLLGGRADDPAMRERLATWPTAPASAFVNFITSGDWEGEPWYTQARIADPIVTGAVKGERISVRFFKPGTAGAGEGECAAELGVECDVAWWDAPDDVRKERMEAMAREATARMDAMFPGFSGRVVHVEVVPPDVFTRAVRAPHGLTSGYLPTPKAAMAESRRTVPGVAGLYLAGQWAIAGAGVLAVLYSGRHAVQILCHDDGRSFVTRID